MTSYLADTVALVRNLRNGNLGQAANQVFLDAEEGKNVIYISAVTLMEILYLSEARRIDVHVAEVVELIRNSDNYILAPLDESVVLVAEGIDDIRELHDRLIAATAKFYNLPVLTSDSTLAESKHIKTLW